VRDSDLPDHYDVLQLSPRADQDTIQRVYRHLAKRFHPDNGESGDADRFKRILEAFRVLSDPERRARYDVKLEQHREDRWRIFDQASALNDVASDRQVRMALLSILYTSRRNDPERPGVGVLDLEHLLGCPEQHMAFHTWYLRENGWVERRDDGTLAITASGVDHVLDLGGPIQPGLRLLEPGDGKQPPPPKSARSERNV
jgi:curved DNA-binding protein CbpA